MQALASLFTSFTIFRPHYPSSLLTASYLTVNMPALNPGPAYESG